jgi:hypothetical protein
MARKRELQSIKKWMIQKMKEKDRAGEGDRYKGDCDSYGDHRLYPYPLS